METTATTVVVPVPAIRRLIDLLYNDKESLLNQESISREEAQMIIPDAVRLANLSANIQRQQHYNSYISIRNLLDIATHDDDGGLGVNIDADIGGDDGLNKSDVAEVKYHEYCRRVIDPPRKRKRHDTSTENESIRKTTSRSRSCQTSSQVSSIDKSVNQYEIRSSIARVILISLIICDVTYSIMMITMNRLHNYVLICMRSLMIVGWKVKN
jgi:hypothetical protein